MGIAGWQWLFLAEGFPCRNSQRHLSLLFAEQAFRGFVADRRGTRDWPRRAAGARTMTRLENRARNRLANQIGKAAGERHGEGAASRHPESAGVAARHFSVVHLHRFLCVLVFGAKSFSRRPDSSNTNVGFAIAVMGHAGRAGLVLNVAALDRAASATGTVVPCVLIAAFIVGGRTVAPIFALLAYAIIFIASNATWGRYGRSLPVF